MAALTNADPWIRHSAVGGIAKLGGAASPAYPTLVAMQADPEAIVQSQIGYAIGRVATDMEIVVRDLSPMLVDPAPRVRRSGVHGLGIAAQRRDTSEPGMKEAAALVAEKLDDTDKEVRYWATWMMMHFKTAARPHVSALLAQLHDSDNHVQEIALFALRALKLEPSTVVPVLWKRFNESTGDTRLRAAIALRAFGDEAEKIQPGLIAMLGSLGEKEFAAGQAELRRAMARP